MFSFYGSKYSRSLAGLYPAPKHKLVIEPFAGSAGYSLAHRHPDRDVLLIDSDPRVVGVWRYLLRASPGEIRRLPAVVRHLDDHPDLPQEARWLIGWWLAKANASPRPRPSAWVRSRASNCRSPGGHWGEIVRERLARQAATVRHWRVIQGDYRDAPGVAATWFVDPPYRGRAGESYAKRFCDHHQLGDWCRTRRGQVVVCEHAGASWLPFRPLGSGLYRDRKEVYWSRG